MAIVFTILVGHDCESPKLRESFIYHFGVDDPVEKCEEFWGTVPRSMYTLYQVTTLESWSQVIARPIWDVKPHYMVLVLSFQLLTTFGLLNIVVAAVVDGTMNCTDEFVMEKKMVDETAESMHVVRSIFSQCAGADGLVTQAQLVEALQDRVVRRKLLTMNISYDDAAQIFRILDPQDKGAIGCAELTRGFMRIRGTAKSKDLLAVRALIYRTGAQLTGDIKAFEAKFNVFQATTQEQFQKVLDAMASQAPREKEPKKDVEVKSDIQDQVFKEQISDLGNRIDGLLGTSNKETTTSGTTSGQVLGQDAKMSQLLVEGPKR